MQHAEEEGRSAPEGPTDQFHNYHLGWGILWVIHTGYPQFPLLGLLAQTSNYL